MSTADLDCARVRVATEGDGRLAGALAQAAPGDCVVVDSGSYRGNFTVPSDVSLVASEGASVVLLGESAEAPALRVLGGRRTTVRGIRIASAKGAGILVDPGPAALINVSVQQAERGALIASCAEPDCDQRQSRVKDSSFTHSKLGVWVVGVPLAFEGSAISDHSSPSLGGGHGVIASGGAVLSLRGTVIERNAEIGVLVDGSQGTSAFLEDVVVRDNAGRGIWAQGLVGTLEAPKLLIRGGATDIRGNGIVGLGVRGSTGVVVEGGAIRDTRVARIFVSLGTPENVGDGVGLFAGSGEARLEGVALVDNARSQMLVDSASGPVSAANLTAVSGGQYKVVIQKSDRVTVPPAVVSTPARELGVSAPTVPVTP